MQSSRSKKVNRAWLHDHLNDPYVKLAQRHHYRARAAFKLIGIDEQDHLIRPGMTVVDLGSAPGSWSQVVRRRLAAPNLAEDVRKADDLRGEAPQVPIQGRIVALDLLPMEPIPDVNYLQGDFREQDVLDRLEALLDGGKVDLVLSDMAPNLSGVGVAWPSCRWISPAAGSSRRERCSSRCSMAAATASWCGFSRTTSPSCSHASPRPRVTARRKPICWAAG